MGDNENNRSIKYPENREIGKWLNGSDKKMIAEFAGISIGHCRNIFQGTRNNDIAIAFAKRIIEKRKADIDSLTDRLL